MTTAGFTKDYNVLVVETSAHMARLLQTLLYQCGFKHVIIALSEVDAVKMLKHGKVDVALCDWTDANSDGFKILQKIRNLKGPFDTKLPVIMMAADASVAKVTQARDAGATEFIAKPVSVKSLTKALWSALEKGRPFIEADHFFGPDRRRRRLDVKNPRRRSDRAETADGQDRESA